MNNASPLRVAVIGAGMAGKAHAAAYRAASTVFESHLPPVELVAIGDVNERFGSAAAKRFGFGRTETDWRDIAKADDIDVVSVVVANHLHREVVEGICTVRLWRVCSLPESMCCVKSRYPIRSSTPRRWPTAPGQPARSRGWV